MNKRPAFTASLFAGLVAVVAAFQAALAFGAPWGQIAMGGAFPSALPPTMRPAAIAQGALLVLTALVVLSRAGLVLQAWRRTSAWLIWAVAALLAVTLALNLITPSALERAIWAPVAAVLLLASLRVALWRGGGGA